MHLKKRLRENESSLECIQSIRLEMYHTMMYKVVMLFGIMEVTGFIQLGDGSQALKIVSLLFRLLYNVIRSMRGAFMFLVLVVFCRRARNGVFHMFCRSANDNS